MLAVVPSTCVPPMPAADPPAAASPPDPHLVEGDLGESSLRGHCIQDIAHSKGISSRSTVSTMDHPCRWTRTWVPLLEPGASGSSKHKTEETQCSYVQELVKGRGRGAILCSCQGVHPSITWLKCTKRHDVERQNYKNTYLAFTTCPSDIYSWKKWTNKPDSSVLLDKRF
jgi:hypothetical protein